MTARAEYIVLGNLISQKKKYYLPGKDHNPATSNVFNLFSNSLTRLPKILSKQNVCQNKLNHMVLKSQALKRQRVLIAA
jgi:hypothetical protein